MKRTSLPFLLFCIAELAVIVFILATTASLPELIASHFDGAGTPNAYMSKPAYIRFMLLFSVGIPTLVASVVALITRAAGKSIWPAAMLGVLLAVFIAYVHWLILQAHHSTSPQLSNIHLFAGMAIFAICLLGLGIRYRD